MTRPGKVRTRCRSDPGSERMEMLPTIAMGVPPVTNLVLDDRCRRRPHEAVDAHALRQHLLIFGFLCVQRLLENGDGILSLRHINLQ